MQHSSSKFQLNRNHLLENYKICNSTFIAKYEKYFYEIFCMYNAVVTM